MSIDNVGNEFLRGGEKTTKWSVNKTIQLEFEKKLAMKMMKLN